MFRKKKEHYIDDMYENVYFSSKTNSSLGAYVLYPKTQVQNRKYAIFLHGSNCDRREMTRVAKLQNFADLGYVLLVPDCSGFGDSEEWFNKKRVDLDIEACFKYFKENFGADEVVLVAHSIGGAMALEYCKHFYNSKLEKFYMPKMLFLIAPFVSLERVHENFILWKFLAKCIVAINTPITTMYSYNSTENIQYTDNKTTFIVHGMNDELIRYQDGADLANIGGVNFMLTNHTHIGIVQDFEIWSWINYVIRERKDSGEDVNTVKDVNGKKVS